MKCHLPINNGYKETCPKNDINTFTSFSHIILTDCKISLWFHTINNEDVHNTRNLKKVSNKNQNRNWIYTSDRRKLYTIIMYIYSYIYFHISLCKCFVLWQSSTDKVNYKPQILYSIYWEVQPQSATLGIWYKPIFWFIGDTTWLHVCLLEELLLKDSSSLMKTYTHEISTFNFKFSKFCFYWFGECC